LAGAGKGRLAAIRASLNEVEGKIRQIRGKLVTAMAGSPAKGAGKGKLDGIGRYFMRSLLKRTSEMMSVFPSFEASRTMPAAGSDTA